MRDLAIRLVSEESNSDPLSEMDGRAAFRVCEKLRAWLSTSAGVSGFRSFQCRALMLAKLVVPWLGRLHVRPDGSFDDLSAITSQLEKPEVVSGGVALVAQLLDLLATLMGDDFALGLVQEIWPKALLTGSDGEVEMRRSQKMPAHNPPMRSDAHRGGADLDSHLQPLASPIIERGHLPMIKLEGSKHIVSLVNTAFCRLLQKNPADLLGKRFAEIVGNSGECAERLNRFCHMGEFETQLPEDQFAESPADWLHALWPARGPNLPPVPVVIQVSKSGRYSQNIAAINEALHIGGLRQHESRDLAERSNERLKVEIAELKIAKGQAERASQAKDDFIAALSHELRIPLTPVLLTAAALREDDRLPADVRKLLGMIEHNINLEARLIDDLLDLTRISHGKLQLRLEPCDMGRLIDFAVQIVQEEARTKKVSVEHHNAGRRRAVMGDPTRLQQVVWNLLRNAVKFTPKGGRISICTREVTTGEGSTWLRLEVEDTGIGIEPAKLEQIFLPFFQSGLAADHRIGGLGLGLSIARAVVDLHGGRVSAHSEGINRGAIFVVELPNVVEPRRAVVGASSNGRASIQGSFRPNVPALRLLVVEDHASTLQALDHLLRRDGYQISATSTMAEALAAASLHRFDLVISDLSLPDGTGIDLMRKLSSTYGLRGIALTGYGMDVDITHSRAAGFSTHLVKPVPIAELRRAIVSLAPAQSAPT